MPVEFSFVFWKMLFCLYCLILFQCLLSLPSFACIFGFISSSCIVSFSVIFFYLFVHCIISLGIFSFFSTFASCYSFFICLSNLISHLDFVFLFKFFWGIPFNWFILILHRLVRLVCWYCLSGYFNTLLTLSISMQTFVQLGWIRDGEVTFFSVVTFYWCCVSMFCDILVFNILCFSSCRRLFSSKDTGQKLTLSNPRLLKADWDLILKLQAHYNVEVPCFQIMFKNHLLLWCCCCWLPFFNRYISTTFLYHLQHAM